MLRPVFWLTRWIVALALLVFAVAAVRSFAAGLDGQALPRSMALWVGAAGLAGRWLLGRLPGRGGGDPLEFLDTLEHELTHAAVGVITFAPPVSLTATLRGGGEVELKRSNPAAALAPYCLPLYAALLAPLTIVLRDGWSGYGRLAVAFLLGSFAWRLMHEFHFGQTDFREFGLVFSMVFIAGALPLCLLGVLDVAGLADVPWREAGRLFLEQGGWVWDKIPVGTAGAKAGTG